MRTSLYCGLLVLSLAGCGDSENGDDTSTMTADAATTNDAETTTNTSPETGDGDAETGDGDGDGDATGDGDSATGDGDGDSATGDGDGDSATGDGDGDGEFTLTSPVFAEGEIIPSLHHIQGGNVSPALEWVNAPADTMSFGVFFHDQTISFDHSAIWDIPASATGLPQDVEHQPQPANVAGALQCRNWADSWGYGGPGSNSNFYQFTLYALDVETLPNVTSMSNRSAVKTELEAHAIATATLAGQTEGPP